ncbi:MAG: hypothetical protein M0C28_32095 [Candidatus Moduliflexus flocculans]|nr:hypothetical protein [Candidatus Moduliflexus flocculans]
MARAAGPSILQISSPQDFDILASAVRHIRSDYVDEADPKRTMEGAFQGLMGSLDAMSSYLDASLMAKAPSPRKDKLFDIGLAVYKRPGVFPSSSASEKGPPPRRPESKSATRSAPSTTGRRFLGAITNCGSS